MKSIEEMLELNLNKIQESHDIMMLELRGYNDMIVNSLQLYTEYETLDELTEDMFLEYEQESLFTLLGTSAAVLYVYIKSELFEFASQLHYEMKKSFLLIMDKLVPHKNNEEKFTMLIESMFESFKYIEK